MDIEKNRAKAGSNKYNSASLLFFQILLKSLPFKRSGACGKRNGCPHTSNLSASYPPQPPPPPIDWFLIQIEKTITDTCM
mmetsp:Transcript_63650/g.109321  ORF Transcript_63650/g.109321 Transcript_63650/m.109321 type:complete len:80 (-) Transcript_63650:8-247(-)